MDGANGMPTDRSTSDGPLWTLVRLTKFLETQPIFTAVPLTATIIMPLVSPMTS